MIEFNNNKTKVTKEEIGEKMWDLLQVDANKARTKDFDRTFDGESSVTVVRMNTRWFVVQKSSKKDDIEVYRYETLHH